MFSARIRAQVRRYLREGYASGAATWYTDGASALALLCEQEGYDFGDFVDVLAITSPRVNVRENLRLAVLHTEDPRGRHSKTMPMVYAGLKHWRATGEIRGPKTSAFADAFKGVDTDDAVLDVWMGRAFGLSDETRWTRAHRRAANRYLCQLRDQCHDAGLDVDIHAIQACIWWGAYLAKWTGGNPPTIQALVAEALYSEAA